MITKAPNRPLNRVHFRQNVTQPFGFARPAQAPVGGVFFRQAAPQISRRPRGVMIFAGGAVR
jgi:hypothetical protein